MTEHRVASSKRRRIGLVSCLTGWLFGWLVADWLGCCWSVSVGWLVGAFAFVVWSKFRCWLGHWLVRWLPVESLVGLGWAGQAGVRFADGEMIG